MPTNPCRIRGAGVSRTVHQTKVASLPELAMIVEAMPSRYRAMVLLAAWCGLRFGELAELRRRDVDLEARVLRVERGVTSRDGQVFVGDPKSHAGKRTVAVPPHLVAVLERHLGEHVEAGKDALLSRRITAGTSRRRRCTIRGGRHGRQPDGRICASTTCGTPAPRWQPP